MDETEWRVGSHYDIHIYNTLGIPIATAMTAESAAQIVKEHNLIREMTANQKLVEDQIKAQDNRPHSRACGIHQHPHGTMCSNNCPTCGGKSEESSKRCEVHGVFHVFGVNCR
jgi:hypothetical protein